MCRATTSSSNLPTNAADAMGKGVERPAAPPRYRDPTRLPARTETGPARAERQPLDTPEYVGVVLDLYLPPMWIESEQAPATRRQESCTCGMAPKVIELPDLRSSSATPGPSRQSAVEARPAVPAEQGLGSWFIDFVAALWALGCREIQIRRQIAELSELDDRVLRDVGIPHRRDIPHIVRHGRQPG